MEGLCLKHKKKPPVKKKTIKKKEEGNKEDFFVQWDRAIRELKMRNYD